MTDLDIQIQDVEMHIIKLKEEGFPAKEIYLFELELIYLRKIKQEEDGKHND